MYLRIEVNQAEAFRRGIDCPKSVASVEVHPLNLDQDMRDLIAKRMEGIDVLSMSLDPEGKVYRTPMRITADEPTVEGLVEAVENDEKNIDPDFEVSSIEIIRKRLKAVADQDVPF